MATYKEIKGTTVKVRSSSMPTAYPQVAGELYYNSSNGKYEFLGLAAGAWSSGGNLNTARQSGGGLGIQTASLMVAGETGSILNIVENVRRNVTITQAEKEFNDFYWEKLCFKLRLLEEGLQFNEDYVSTTAREAFAIGKGGQNTVDFSKVMMYLDTQVKQRRFATRG